jgi:ribosomal protein S18 acetylase RimI-like enzyme
MEKSRMELPKDFTVRGANLDDVEPALKLYNAWSQAVIQQDEITNADGIRNEWVSPGFDPAQDIRLVFSPDGMMVGYIEVWTTAKPPVHPWIWGRVHPDFGGLGIGTWLLQWADEHACKVLDNLPADLRFAPRIGTYRPAIESKKLFGDMGYRQIRSSYNMQIDMDDAPPAPIWADGITLKIFSPETDTEAVYKANDEAFRDHFGHVEAPYEEGLSRFKHFMMEENFDPNLWFLAMAGNEIAGVSLCRPRSYGDPDMGYVDNLSVRRAWRKKGVGLALLRCSFGEFYRRGYRKVGLGVDAENLTGALRLYEKAGMYIRQAFDLYEKTIRDGREVSVEMLAE